MAIKNLWSINVDEVILADKLRQKLGKEYQVFFPVNSQLKDIDLIIYNLNSGIAKSIQVKGSRTYEPKKFELERYGNGCASWFKIGKNSIVNPKNQIDFFIFVIHVDELTSNKRRIIQKYLIIPINEFRNLTDKKQMRKDDYYHYFFWINSNNQKAIDINNKITREIDYTKFLNNFDLLKF